MGFGYCRGLKCSVFTLMGPKQQVSKWRSCQVIRCAGLVTSAAENRASISRIMEVIRHRDPRTVETDVRRADWFKDDAGYRFL